MATRQVVQQALKVPGLLLDIGCASGGSLLFAAQLAEADTSSVRECWGFDSFAPVAVCEKDSAQVKQNPSIYAIASHGGDIAKLIGEWALDHRTRIRFCPGDITQSFRMWAEERTQPICWVHFGTGCYLPTKEVLRYMPDRMPVGGVICSGNWGNGWIGEMLAVQEFLVEHPDFVMEEAGVIVRQGQSLPLHLEPFFVQEG